MKRKIEMMKWFNLMFVSTLFVMLSACSNDDNGAQGKATAEFDITDAPSDDADISGVFVTVTDIKVDGKSFAGFTGKQTINLKEFQNGNTKKLGTGEIDAGSHGNVSLVLDLQTDANGDSPGCYVMTTDHTKYSLTSSSDSQMEITPSNGVGINTGSNNTIVFDFDLRKSVESNSNATIRYQFVSHDKLNSGLRIVRAEETGMIKGTYHENVSTHADKVVVYAYKSGTFNADTETQSASGQLFSHAVTSATVNGQLTGSQYTLAFLEKGDYELHFASYNEDSGKATFEAMLESETSVDGNAANMLSVTAGANLQVAAVIKGTL